MKFTFTPFFTFTLLFLSAGLLAQPCFLNQPTINSFADLNATQSVGQTFTACGDGVVTEITVSLRDSVGKVLTLELFNAADRLSALDTQLVYFGGAGEVSILLHRPFSVLDGEQYAFSFKGAAVNFNANDGDILPGGNVFRLTNGNFEDPGADLTFSLGIVPDACTQFQGAATQTFFLQDKGIGQVFTACATGALTEVSIEFTQVDDDTLFFDIVSVDSINGMPLYRQLILNPRVGETTIELETPFLVTDSVQYGFLLKTTANTNERTRVQVNNTNPYAGGTNIEIFGSNVLLPASFDMKFGVTIVRPINLIDQPTANSFANSSSAITVGQSFTAPKNGRISHIRFSTVEANLTEMRLDLNLGSDTRGADYSQVSTISGSGDHLIPLAQGFNVLEGETYSFSLTATNDATGNINGFNGNPYPGGQAFTINGGNVTPFGVDLDFSILMFEDDGVVSIGSAEDLSTQLYDAFPNPARDQFTVSYSLDQGREVSVQLYDMMGRQLRQVNKGRQPAGAYQETIDVANLPAGMYLYGIRTETGRSITKRIVIN